MVFLIVRGSRLRKKEMPGQFAIFARKKARNRLPARDKWAKLIAGKQAGGKIRVTGGNLRHRRKSAVQEEGCSPAENGGYGGYYGEYNSGRPKGAEGPD